MIQILIADDHTIVRRGLLQILKDGFPDAVIDEVADAESIVKNIHKKNYDVIISDLSMPGRSGLEVLPQIKSINADIPILILSIHHEDHYAVRVLKAGASGYMSKDLAPEELVLAVKRVLQGKKYITESVAEKLSTYYEKEKTFNSHQLLSDREFSVLQFIASGKSITEIAESMLLSVTTVSTYRSRILSKLNLKNNAELIMFALENNIISQS